MYAVKKMRQQKSSKKATDILSTPEEVKAFRVTLEQKTEEAFEKFSQSKQKVREMAHLKYLD
jgi:hypothetical protein